MHDNEGGDITDEQAMKETEGNTPMDVEETVERTPLCESLPISSQATYAPTASASDATMLTAHSDGRHHEPLSPADSQSDPLVHNMARLAIHPGDTPSPHTR